MCDRCNTEIRTKYGTAYEPRVLTYADEGMGAPEWHLCPECKKDFDRFLRGWEVKHVSRR